MAKRTEVARWRSIMAKLDHKMEMDKLHRAQKTKKEKPTDKKVIRL